MSLMELFLTEIASAVVGAIVGMLASHVRFRRVMVRTHRAWELPPDTTSLSRISSHSTSVSATHSPEQSTETGLSGQRLYVKIINMSRHDVEVTHVWLATKPEVDLIALDPPLPIRLRAEETHEVWFPLDDLPVDVELERLVRVRLSSGKTVRSRWNRNVPPVGGVARARG
jgi:hypothetical protein